MAKNDSENIINVDFRGPMDCEVLASLFHQFVGHLKERGFKDVDIEDAIFDALIDHIREWQNIPSPDANPKIPAYELHRELLRAISGYFVERFDVPTDDKGNILLPRYNS